MTTQSYWGGGDGDGGMVVTETMKTRPPKSDLNIVIYLKRMIHTRSRLAGIDLQWASSESPA